MSKLLSCEIVEHNPLNQPIDKAVIWLHGLGASGNDFVPVVPHLGLPDNLAVRFVFPHAPSIPVTINGGYVMPAWYDILERSIDRKVDVEQIALSGDKIAKLVDEQIRQGVPSQNIIIAGFSQGGAVAYHHALTSKKPLAGLLALSTYFATAEQVTSVSDKALPVLIHHGEYDDTVPEILGVRAKTALLERGMEPKYHNYAMAHQVCMEQIKDIGVWMTEIFAKK
ncbi:alpha/beta hydrolase [Moraxella oblonga]|uniref:alpha/beta hydrolase n=1 Tax=Moraxella oblonga TaxID=200413 RepID=UPI00082C4A62|nr:carboxylesterase [Moraxella oblonga]